MPTRRNPYPLAAILIAAIFMGACQSVAAPQAGVVTLGPSSAATATSLPVPTALRTPPALPEVYQSSYLNVLDTPHEYVGDRCQYLHNKWGTGKAAPGTVVMVIMLHSITKGHVESQDAVGSKDFDVMMAELHLQQFQAIDTQQLADFLESNASIPPRSMLLLQDGRRYADNFNQHFRPYWNEWHWPVVNAWDYKAPSADSLWEQNAALEKEGWVDHQVYGMPLPASTANLSGQYFQDELEKSLPTFQEYFHKSPLAIVWPGGLNVRAIEAARQLDYRLGFTPNSRGPLMYNWIPLADDPDPARPAYLPEGGLKDPLMTLPRYRPDQVRTELDAVRLIGKQAGAYAEQNKQTELEYYDIVCAPKYGPIP